MKLGIEIVRDLKVIHDGIEHFIHFAWGCKQTDSLQAVNHVHFSLTTPLTSRIEWRSVLPLRISQLLNGVGGFNRDGTEFCLTLLTREIVAPEASLSFEPQVATNWCIFEIQFLCEDVRRQPQARLDICTPAVKVTVVTSS